MALLPDDNENVFKHESLICNNFIKLTRSINFSRDETFICLYFVIRQLI